MNAVMKIISGSMGWPRVRPTASFAAPAQNTSSGIARAAGSLDGPSRSSAHCTGASAGTTGSATGHDQIASGGSQPQPAVAVERLPAVPRVLRGLVGHARARHVVQRRAQHAGAEHVPVFARVLQVQVPCGVDRARRRDRMAGCLREDPDTTNQTKHEIISKIHKH